MSQFPDKKEVETTISTAQERKRALLVSVYENNRDLISCKEHLDELALLCDTYGIDTAKKFACLLRKFEASTYITKGKVEEIQLLIAQENPDLVVFDDEISPGQQRNLEAAFSIPVVDRTEIILGVFAQRAQTKEARLQVELAQVKYQAPRLKRLWTHLSRQAGSGGGGSGGGAYLKGEGEKQIEIDKRLLKNRIEILEKELKDVKAIRQTQRVLRERNGIPVFAIIGYTNAGKSTLLNALTDAGVFVENKLFATLDTTTRKYCLPNNQEILIIDTVGFIRKLPHLLVAAFKSTLEEALQADILLHLVDASHPLVLEHAETTFEVLQELGAAKKPIITVLNKIDQCNHPEIIQQLRAKYSKTVTISALHHTGFADLIDAMQTELSFMRKSYTLRIPQSEYAIVSDIMRLGNIHETEYEENDVVLRAELPAALANKLSRYIQDE